MRCVNENITNGSGPFRVPLLISSVRLLWDNYFRHTMYIKTKIMITSTPDGDTTLWDEGQPLKMPDLF